MFCDRPDCSKVDGSRVIDSRPGADSQSIRRRRECINCGKRFTTYERIEEYELVVIKKDAATQKYDKTKIVKGILTACEKRPVSIKQIENIVFLIEKELIESGKREIQSSQIGELVIKHLYSIDQVAYIRFASVYRSFDDLSQFLDELNKLVKKD
ncbi:MAG: transcriptional regulator NrdR [Thermodesulfobacteriota bacterium]|jgi:transcriptional repressor NrdR|nr:transcriptional regulator NrdR [Thermodesulfobacteriota bacterium]